MLIKSTKDTPFVYLSAEECKIEIMGDSFSISVNDLYEQIFNWIENNLPAINNELTCRFYLKTLNSESSRMIVELISRLNKYKYEGKEIKLVWEYDEDNEHIYEKGIDFYDFSVNRFEFRKNISESNTMNN